MEGKHQGTSDRPTQEPGEEDSAPWPFLGLLSLPQAADRHKEANEEWRPVSRRQYG